MAYIGLAKPTVAGFDETTNTYKEPFKCGKAIQIDIEPQYAEGSLYGDNVKGEYDKEFTYANVKLNTTTIPIQAHKIMFGHKVAEDGNKVTFSAGDDSKYVGFGFYVTEKVNGARRYVASWLPKVIFFEGAESYKTKGDAIEYQTPSIEGQALVNAEKVWKEVEAFNTEREAEEWIQTKSGESAGASV